MFEFGAGMSYTTFDIQWDKAPVQLGRTHDTVSYAATVTNTGNRGKSPARIDLQWSWLL